MSHVGGKNLWQLTHGKSENISTPTKLIHINEADYGKHLVETQPPSMSQDRLGFYFQKSVKETDDLFELLASLNGIFIPKPP